METKKTFSVYFNASTGFWRVREYGRTIGIFKSPRDAFSFCVDNNVLGRAVTPIYKQKFILN